MAGLLSVAYFLVSLFFSLILLVFWLRIALHYFRVSALHPLGKMIYHVSDPVLRPLERLIYKAHPPRYDWLCLIVIILIEMVKFLILGFILYNTRLPFGILSLLVVADLIIQPCNLLFYALLFRVILSWVNTGWQHHPAAAIIELLTNPLIRLGHKIVPNISGFDFSPFLMMVILKVITLFISASVPLGMV